LLVIHDQSSDFHECPSLLPAHRRARLKFGGSSTALL
jgi:hypothetical protein